MSDASLIPQRIDRAQQRRLVRGVEAEEDPDESRETEGEHDREGGNDRGPAGYVDLERGRDVDHNTDNAGIQAGTWPVTAEKEAGGPFSMPPCSVSGIHQGTALSIFCP